MPRPDSWSADWCCEKLLSHDKILEATTRTGNSVRLVVKDMALPVIVATMSEPRVELTSVPDEFHQPETEFLLNIPKDAYFSGPLLEFASTVPIGVGGLGDLYTAANEQEFRHYIPKETRFILRVLAQHTAVRTVSRINNRTYLILKHSGKEVRVLALNEYDLTGDAVRSGIDKYGLPNFILASNPNCRFSAATKDVARAAGTDVLVLSHLLGALND